MGNRLRKASLFGAALVLMALALQPVGGNAATTTKTAHGGVMVHHFTRAEQRATLRYWTPARMAAAKPLDLVKVSGTPSASAVASSPTGPAGAIAPSAPGRASTATKRPGSVPCGWG